MKNIQFALLIALVALAACRKNHLLEHSEIIAPDPEIFVEAEVQGTVVDESGAPVADASVRLDTATTTTDAGGKFKFKGVWDTRRALVRVEKKGFFPSFRDFEIEPQKVATVFVKLFDKGTPHLVSQNFGEVAGQGDTIVFPFKPKFKDSDGVIYSDAVVFFRWIDPVFDDNSLPTKYLEAPDSTEQPRVLESFGTFQVLLESADGKPLQILSPARLSFRISPSKPITDPFAELPCYFLDEKTGLWRFENWGYWNGDGFACWVSHFSVWTFAR